MMKNISIPTSIVITREEEMFAKVYQSKADEIEARWQECRDEHKEATNELDSLLNTGWSVVATYEKEIARQNILFLILHKPDRPAPGTSDEVLS